MEEKHGEIDILKLIPEGIALDILTLQDDKTLVNCASVSKYWNHLCHSNKKLKARIRNYLCRFEETSKPKSGTSTILESSSGIVMPRRQNRHRSEVVPYVGLRSFRNFTDLNIFARLKRRRIKTARPSRIPHPIKFISTRRSHEE